MQKHSRGHSEFKSALYFGTVWHSRFEPRPHHFSYNVFMMYLDLSEIDAVFGLSRLWSSKKNTRAPARYERKHYFSHPDFPELDLADAVRQKVHDDLSFRPTGAIRLLTNLKYFGYLTNPISVYYCFDEREELQAILLEVTNTPWGERHAYAIDCRLVSFSKGAEFDKKMHVSPFIPMNMRYRWRGEEPVNGSLKFTLKDYQVNDEQEAEQPYFAAGVNLSRVEISRKSLNSALIRFPLMTVKVITGIYWQALRLWAKRIAFLPHPKRENMAEP